MDREISAWDRAHADHLSHKRLEGVFRELDAWNANHFPPEGDGMGKEYQCKDCDQTFENRIVYASHVRFTHPKKAGRPPKNPKPSAIPLGDFPCPTCGSACRLVPVGKG